MYTLKEPRLIDHKMNLSTQRPIVPCNSYGDGLAGYCTGIGAGGSLNIQLVGEGGGECESLVGITYTNHEIMFSPGENLAVKVG